MFRKSMFIFISMMAFGSASYAANCPEDIQKIDAALANSPAITEAELSDARALRALGEEQCITGKIEDATATLGDAKKILGIQ